MSELVVVPIAADDAWVALPAVALYAYTCAGCGSFDVMRPMGAAAAQERCPACGAPARRVFSAPALTAPRAPRRRAQDAAERSAHEPAVTAGPPPRPAPPTRPRNPLHARLPRP